MVKVYIKKDNNGGWNVSTITLIIMIVIAVIPPIYAYGKMNEKVTTLEAELEKVKTITNSIDVIQTDIKYIKEHIQEINNKLGD